jgi:membrane-bound lytic murein transglycosylase D
MEIIDFSFNTGYHENHAAFLIHADGGLANYFLCSSPKRISTIFIINRPIFIMLNYKIKIFFILVFMILCLEPLIAFSQTKSSEPSVLMNTDVPLPEHLLLCGESIPLNDSWSWEMLDRELTIAAWDTPQVFLWLKRAGRYFPYIEKKLAQKKMPDDLKYLAVAESSLLCSVKSNQGAVGTWQFIAETGERNGLRTDKSLDERRDLVQSTEAALDHLRSLKDMFGTWSLAMAAYNCGENRVKKEMKDQQENDFYRLKLPEETERYIYKIAAIKLIMENPESYGYIVPESKMYKPIKCDTLKVNITNKIHITNFAKAMGTTFKMIKYLNPQIIDDYLPPGSYNLNTPYGTGEKVPRILVSLSSQPASAVSEKALPKKTIKH